MRSRTGCSGRLPFALSILIFVAACGGGGGGGGDGDGPANVNQPPPPSSSISGVVMLGPVAGADVVVAGTSGMLGSATTGTNGRFGPISYSGSYTGPLRITVTGNAGSTWTCDFQLGCVANGNLFAPGQAVEFNGTLEAVVSNAVDGDFVSVSLLSNFTAKRVDLLGNLSSANVNAAQADIARSLRSVLGNTLGDLSVSLPDDFASIELFDLHNLPAPGGPNDRLSVILTLLNSALMGLVGQPFQTTGDFLDSFTAAVAAPVELPISAPNFFDPSQESFVTFFLLQGIEIADGLGPINDSLNALLSPLDLTGVINSGFDTLIAMPGLFVGTAAELNVLVDDLALQGPIVRELQIFTSTGVQLPLSDHEVAILLIDGAIWLDVSVVSIAGVPHVRFDFDNAVIATLANGTYDALVDTHSTSGNFRRSLITVRMNRNLVAKQVDAGLDISTDERSTVVLGGSTNLPSEVVAVNWVQTSGPSVTITGSDTFQPSIEIPGIDADQTATLRLDVKFTTGEMRSDSVNINIQAFPNIADLTFADVTLQQCINDAVIAGNLTDAGELMALNCPGIASASGIEAFISLTSLELAGSTLDSLQSILLLSNLEFLDISGNPSLPCDEIDQLAERLNEGTELIVNDTCQGSFVLDLAADGFDAALDTARNQIYVSIPDRNELAVISLAELRIIDRLLLPGAPYGIDLSIDGTRLFVALNGSNSVAVVDIDQRAVSIIDLGASTGHATTYDVVEAEPDRLFVSANAGISGSYIAQVLLDQGNISSRVADGLSFGLVPAFARDPDQQFVYVTNNTPSLYKLNLSDPDAPIVLRTGVETGIFGDTDHLTINSTGTRIAFRFGQVLLTESFVIQGRVSNGRSVRGDATDTLFVAGPDGLIESFDFTTLALTDSKTTSCDNGTTFRIVVYEGDQSFMLLQGDSACLHAVVSRSTPPDPFAALRFTDLALEECVVDTAIVSGFTQPEEFTALDCSATGETIVDLDGIERLTNLATLDLSNSGIFDLSPLASMASLQSLTIANANTSNAAALFSIGTLTFIDLTGNPGAICADLDQFASTGIAVQADQCTEIVRVELGAIGHDMEFDPAGNRVFVSIPSLNQISEVNLDTASIVRTFSLSGEPRGIDLSSDMQTIYAALYGVGDVAVINSTNGNTEVIDISLELEDDRTWDIAEISTDRVVVSTNPGGNGFGRVVEVRRDLGNAATTVADHRTVRSSPIFTVSPDQTAVYVGDKGDSLYKLDATQSTLPIILEDEHGEVTGTLSLALNPAGSRIYLRHGQVLSTDTFEQVAQFPAGLSTVSEDGTRLFVGDDQTDSARVYDITTTGQVGNRQWGCDLINLAVLQEFGDGILVLGDDLVCYSRTVPYP